ncbi:hypothetical protein [Streptomyces sp. NPDC003077]|uniref:hypothetical protein n=1 Tax=Streptomyces sp. NPDC003077 TaxID=3154443 RepID=UPI0033B37496
MVDPVLTALLPALVGGAGGAVGRQAWETLTALVRRPFRGRERTGGDDRTGNEPEPGGHGEADEPEVRTGEPEARTGEAELTALARDPDDRERARQLARVLTERAAADPEFARDLASWQRDAARLLRTGEGDVHSDVTGGSHGAVVQGRDFHGPMHFGTTPPPAPGRRPPEPEE